MELRSGPLEKDMPRDVGFDMVIGFCSTTGTRALEMKLRKVAFAAVDTVATIAPRPVEFEFAKVVHAEVIETDLESTALEEGLAELDKKILDDAAIGFGFAV